MKKTFHLLFVILFFGACLIPGLGLLLNGPSPAAANETAVRAPSFVNPDGSLNLNLLSDAADWFSHSYGFRRELITADSAWKAGLFRSSTQPLVALGKEGWLYYAETLDDYTGADSLSPRQTWCIARSLKLAQDYVQSQGAAFVFTVAPNKASIYPEYLPDGLSPAPSEYSAPLAEVLQEQDVQYASLFEPLRTMSGRSEQSRSLNGEPLYFALDSHWTNRGAALAHDVLLEALGLPSEDAFGKAGGYQPSHLGDLYEMLYPASLRLDLEFAFDPPLDFQYARPIRDVDDLTIETASASENGPLLMFRDSFGNALHSLMAESFSTALFSRAMPYNLERMESIGTEYVVVEIVERNLPLLAEGAFLFPAPEVDLFQPPWGNTRLFQGERWPAESPLAIERAGAYNRITASADIPCDLDSPVYLIHMPAAGGSVTAWEALPLYQEDGARAACTACLPTDRLPEGTLYMAFQQEGKWQMTYWEEPFPGPAPSGEG
ncbi:hypothetical protein D7X94_05340 [Acutalibacter sp. 1XD8-33]|uniref:alginate O-acetyltransferase AlgX-related protein n=1 Tax=Acutalibacter sp. 1XD8-33 TaxID=2320081 RepID=UPI000EA09F37|nr:hypothetical protein [Acutalibacter sp. 1XD8-33]RKJ41220.1 hypothetical protein D7X94_05340 [Acutalibacter sp. 1XD8-33]